MNKPLLLALSCSSLLFAHSANAEQTQEDRIKQLEQKLAVLENNEKKTDWTDNVRISGFGSIMTHKESEDAGYMNLQEADDSWDFETSSKIGLQLNGDFSDSTNFTVQFLSKGVSDWDLDVEWAFISHTFDNDLTVRGGKLRLPVYMFADYLDVGYAQPFIRAPRDVYFPLSVTSYMGIDALYTLDVGDGQLTIQPFWANNAETAPETSNTGSTIDFVDTYGAALKYEYDSLMLRGSYTEGEGETDDPALMAFFNEVDGSFIEFGFRYDFEQLAILGEYTEFEVKSVYPTIESWFVGLIYTFDEFAPYAVISSAETTDNENRALPGGLVSSFDGERMSYSVGLRWDFAPKIAFKADVTYSDDFGNTSGFMLGNTDLVVLPGGTPLPVAVDNFSSVTIFSAGFDFIF